MGGEVGNCFLHVYVDRSDLRYLQKKSGKNE